MTGSASKHQRGLFLMRMAAGAVAGAAGAALTLLFLGKLHPDRGDPGAMLALAAGLSYLFIGLLVGLGALAPRAGATFLNVEDADEIREQRRSLRPSAAVCMLAGLFLLILAVAPGLARSVGRDAVAVAAILCLAALVLISLATRGRHDELTRQIGSEASSLTLSVAFVALAGWASLASVGHAGSINPVALISALALLTLVAIFAISAKRGLMRPR